MPSTNLERQLRFIARQRARGLRLHRLWLSSEQGVAVRELLCGGGNGHNHALEAELLATREALRQAQAEAFNGQSDLAKAKNELASALACIRNLEAENVQMSHRLRTCQASLTDAQRAARAGIVGLLLLSVALAVVLFFL